MPAVTLDGVLHAHGMLGRVECSMTMAEVLQRVDIQTVDLPRDGLGLWSFFVLNIEDRGNFVVGAPKAEDDAGVSIWFETAHGLTQAHTVAIAAAVFGDDEAMFLDPESGVVIEVNFGVLRPPQPPKYTVTSVETVVLNDTEFQVARASLI